MDNDAARASRVRLPVLGTPIDVCSEPGAVAQLLAWARRRESRAVYICNVHSVVTATEDDSFARALRESDLATPDGAPVAWMLRRQGAVHQRRVSGPDLMLACCRSAAEQGVSIYLFGSTEPTLERLTQRLHTEFPALSIAGMHSPPFRPLSPDEDEAVVADIHRSGAGIVWVSLGCPKQERWMWEHRGRVQAVMVGVGAAFDFHAGTTRRAPSWMRNNGLEWLHRLASEPRRLWRRYLVTNALFIAGATRQLFSRRRRNMTSM